MKTRNEIVTEFLQGLDTEIDVYQIAYEYGLENITDFDTLRDAIEDASGFDMEVIYFGSAMEYLTENDPSLQISLGIAAEYEFDLNRLTSETLASLLKSQIVREAFNELENEVNEFFESLEDEDESNFENYSVNTWDEADTFMLCTFGYNTKEYKEFDELGRTDEAIEYAHELGYDIDDED